MVTLAMEDLMVDGNDEDYDTEDKGGDDRHIAGRTTGRTTGRTDGWGKRIDAMPMKSKMRTIKGNDDDEGRGRLRRGQ